MKAPRIDFSGAQHEAGAIGERMLVVAIASLVLAVAGIAIGLSQATQARRLQEMIAERDAAREALQSAVVNQERIPAEATEAVNGVIRMMEYPLIERLNRIEPHVREDVSIISIEAGPVRSSVRLIVEAQTLPQALDFLEELRSEPGYESLAMMRQEPAGNDGGRWRFTFEQPQNDAVRRAVERQPGKGRE